MRILLYSENSQKLQNVCLEVAEVQTISFIGIQAPREKFKAISEILSHIF